MGDLPRIHRGEVDGIPVVWGEDTIPLTAGLDARVATSLPLDGLEIERQTLRSG